MKKLFLIFFIIIASSISVSAQVKALQTVKISTPTVQCDMCKNKIETYLKRYNGVTTIAVNVKKKETTVKYLTDRINEEEIKTAIANAGYDAAEVEANPDSYKKLPVCCKKPDSNTKN
ncbi:MAG TPA: cation transporter [Chitinophagaceae bacterium]|jgi:copper chaperone CopZ|nr:cation transporter [Chitinophagaceae bacterium]